MPVVGATKPVDKPNTETKLEVKQKTNTEPMRSARAFLGSFRTPLGYYPMAPEAEEPILVVAPVGEPVGRPVSRGTPIEDPKPRLMPNSGPVGGPVPQRVLIAPVSKAVIAEK